MCVLLICCFVLFFFFKQKTAYEMRISDWSSDVCSFRSPDERHDPTRRKSGRPGAGRSETAGAAGLPGHQGTADLGPRAQRAGQRKGRPRLPDPRRDRKRVEEGKSVSVRVDPGGRCTIKQKKNNTDKIHVIPYRKSN